LARVNRRRRATANRCDSARRPLVPGWVSCPRRGWASRCPRGLANRRRGLASCRPRDSANPCRAPGSVNRRHRVPGWGSCHLRDWASRCPRGPASANRHRSCGSANRHRLRGLGNRSARGSANRRPRDSANRHRLREKKTRRYGPGNRCRHGHCWASRHRYGCPADCLRCRCQCE
jgi:hypothetical protein